MRIELLTHGKHTPHTGIGRYVHELIKHLGELADIDLCRLQYLPLSNSISRLRQLPVGIESHVPGSIVHFPQITGCSLMLWRPVRPAVATVHDLGVLVCPEDEALFNRFDRWLLDLQFAGLQRMDHYIVHSEQTRNGLISRLGISANSISTVPSSVDIKQFRPIDGAKESIGSKYGIGFDDDVADLLYVGSELPRKNLITLLEAIALLGTRGRRLRLLKVGGAGGDQWRMRFLHDIEALGLENNVEITDVVPEADLPLFYNVADLCVTPTVLEGGFAWLAMEAMACARPVIASSGALVPEEARSAVLVVRPHEPEALANTIQHCMDDKGLRQRMATRGRQIIESYSWEREAQAVVQVYHNVMRLAGA